jgi:hypothetical protein
VVAWARARLAAGAAFAAVCADVDIGEPTLHRFLGTSRASERPARAEAGFTQLQVAASKGTAPTKAVVLRGPCGVTVEGLSIDDVARVLKGLACWA